MTTLTLEQGSTAQDNFTLHQPVLDDSGEPIYQQRDAVECESEIDPQSEGTQKWLVGDWINEAIADSRKLLDLEADWDDNGASPYSEETWARATKFLASHADWALQRDGVLIPAPAVLPGPDGSIDLHWKTQDYELLVNIPASVEEPGNFYGDDYTSLCIKGTFDPAVPNRGLITWLTDRASCR